MNSQLVLRTILKLDYKVSTLSAHDFKIACVFLSIRTYHAMFALHATLYIFPYERFAHSIFVAKKNVLIFII